MEMKVRSQWKWRRRGVTDMMIMIISDCSLGMHKAHKSAYTKTHTILPVFFIADYLPLSLLQDTLQSLRSHRVQTFRSKCLQIRNHRSWYVKSKQILASPAITAACNGCLVSHSGNVWLLCSAGDSNWRSAFSVGRQRPFSIQLTASSVFWPETDQGEQSQVFSIKQLPKAFSNWSADLMG